MTPEFSVNRYSVGASKGFVNENEAACQDFYKVARAAPPAVTNRRLITQTDRGRFAGHRTW